MTPKIILSDANNDEPLYSIDWNETGILAAGGNNTVHFLSQIGEGEFMHEFEEKIHDCDVNCVRWNPRDRTIFASCGDDGLVKVWELLP